MRTLEQQLKDAREMYIFHFAKNHTQARGLNLMYWGRECLRIRAELEATL